MLLAKTIKPRKGEKKEFVCDVIVAFSVNNHEAKNIDDYKQKVKEDYHQQYNIWLTDSEIQNIEER